MYPERLRIVNQEITGLVIQTMGGLWRFTKEHARDAGVALLIACAPQPPQEQIQKPQEPQLPKDNIVLQVTNTPEPATATATSTPEPKQEPTATTTKEPTRAPELPRILRETPIYGIYSGDLFVIEGGQRVIKGSILLSHLPNDSFLLAYNIKEPCSGGQRRTPTAIIPREKITGAGFLVDNRDTFSTPSLMSPQAIGGSLRIKELKISESVCSAIEGLSIGTRLEPGTPNKDGFIDAYLKLSRDIGVNLTREQAQLQIERAYRGPLPEIPAK